MLMRIFAAACIAGMFVAPDASAQRSRDWDRALQARREGKAMPLSQIEAKIRPMMPGAEYLGPEIDENSGVYRLKFMRAGQVVWIDVEAATGRIVGRSAY